MSKISLIVTFLLVLICTITAVVVKDDISSTHLGGEASLWGTLANQAYTPNERDALIKRFQRYLRIKTVHPNIDYSPAVDFLKEQAEEIGLEFKVYEYVKGKPVVVLRWLGQDPNLKAIQFNSHMDVVPVDPESWDHPAFEAEIHDGKIYARGSQDMKSIGMSYLEAIRLLKKAKYVPKRSIVISFVPEEEIGGAEGAKLFTFSKDFEQYNVGVSIDEGGPNKESHELKLYYGERQPWWIVIKATGDPGHGSAFIENLAVRKIYNVMDKVYKFREAQEKLMALHGVLSGEVMTVNINGMKAGHGSSINVVPSEAEIYIDLRIPPHIDLPALYDMIENDWCSEDGVTFSFAQGGDIKARNPITKMDSVFADSIRKLANRFNIQLVETIFPAATDSRFNRLYKSEGKYARIPTFGISPLHETPWLLHDHNEHLPVKVYQESVVFYRELIQSLDSITIDEA